MEGNCFYCCIKMKEEEIVAIKKSFIGENALAGKETEHPSLSLQLTAFRLLFSYRILLLV